MIDDEMNIRQVDEIDQKKWNSFVAQESSFALMQTWEWGEFKEAMGWKAYRVALEQWGEIKAAAQLLVKPLLGGLASIIYIPRGPLCNWSDQKTTTRLFAELHRIARQNNAVFMRIEPPILNNEENHQLMLGYSFRSSRHTNQPRNTVLIDLRPELEEILGQMRQKTRQYIRRAVKEGIIIRIGNAQDLPSAIELVKTTGRREHFPVRSKKYYENEFEIFSNNDECVLLLAMQNNKLLAIRTIYYFGNYAAEFHAGSSDVFDHLHPNYLLVWEAIKLAKSKGCTTYDLWGIPDEINSNIEKDDSTYMERKDGLWGVYRFKSGFSKNVVSYVGAYDYVYSAVPYSFMSIPFIDREKIERLAVWTDFSKRKMKHKLEGK